MYLLDTNVISETRRPRPNPGVSAWFASASIDALHASAVTDYELERGLLALQRRDPRQADRLRPWLISVRRELGPRILDVTAEVARICAGLSVPDRRPFPDALIAATALHHGLIVVTRNEGDFDVPGLRVLNPFD